MKVVAISVMLASIACVPAFAEDAPSLTGTWIGSGKGMTLKGVAETTLKVVVTEQDGNAFKAEITYQKGDKSFTEGVVGAIAPDGRTLFVSGDDGHSNGMVSDAGLDLCYIEEGDEAQVSCARLARQP